MLIILQKHLERKSLKYQNTRLMHTNVQEEIVQDPLPLPLPKFQEHTLPETTKSWISRLEKIKAEYSEKYREKFQQGQPTLSSIPEDNNNLSDYISHTPQTFYVPPIINKEVLLTDFTLKTIVANLEIIDDQFKLQINKSEQLAIEWNNHISVLDKYIESLKSTRWMKLFIYSTCILTTIGFLWKMGVLKSLPSFGANIANLLLDTTKQSNTDLPIVNTPSMNMNSLKDFMESPITPGAFVMGVGGIAILMGTLRAVVWILRKTPK